MNAIITLICVTVVDHHVSHFSIEFILAFWYELVMHRSVQHRCMNNMDSFFEIIRVMQRCPIDLWQTMLWTPLDIYIVNNYWAVDGSAAAIAVCGVAVNWFLL